MTVDIEKLEALAKAASQGNWNQDGFDVQNDDIEDYRVARCKWLADAKFIAAANPAAVLELIGDLKRNQRMLLAAVCQLGEINTALGADMDSDCDELIGMIADLKSEISGLKTGYEAYERVNAELRAECEKLRKDAERIDFIDKNWFYNPYGQGVQFMFNEMWEGEGHEVRTAIDNAMSKEQSHD